MGALELVTAYRYHVRQDGQWSRPFRLRRVLAEVEADLRGPSRIYTLEHDRPGETFETWRRFRSRLSALLKQHRLGITYVCEAHEFDPDARVGKCAVRVSGVAPKPAETTGNDNVDRFVGYLNAYWPGWRNGGICVVKKIAGTNTWSDHSYGGAIDVFDTAEHMEEQREFVRANGVELNATYHILWDDIYKASSFVRESYGGAPHYHGHTSFEHRGVFCA